MNTEANNALAALKHYRERLVATIAGCHVASEYGRLRKEVLESQLATLDAICHGWAVSPEGDQP